MKALSLHFRLAAALLILLLVAGSVNLTSSLMMSRRYLDEVDQMSNRDLALGIAQAKHKSLVAENGQIRQSGLKEVLHWMMVVHPGPHFYLLDLRGEIVAFDPAAGEPEVSRVALAPVREFLDRRRRNAERPGRVAEPQRPLLGDDPRSPDQPAIFSVSPLPADGEPVGYLYIVLRPQTVQTMAESLRSSYILQLGVRNAAAYLLVTVALGLLVFYGMTRPLQQLAVKVDQVRLDANEKHDEQRLGDPQGDEVKRLEERFEAMGERLRRYVEEAEKIDHLRRELFANLSHDLRTPVATLRGYLETLALSRDSLTPEQRSQYVSIALRHSERLSRLVDELLELAKLDSHAVAPNLERFQIGELIQDNVQRFQLRAVKQGIQLRAKLNPDLPSVLADVGLMERALENLIGNALQHTDEGGSITVGLQQASPGKLKICVADTGSGIDPDHLPFIFERFVGAPSSKKSKESGSSTGLGLAITRRIAELHQSELTVDSTVGVGTTFAFELETAPQTITHSSHLGRVTRRTLEWVESLKNRGRSKHETGN